MQRFLVAALWMGLLCGQAADVRAQADVRRHDDNFEYVMAVDQLVYGLVDTVHVTYTVHNITDTTQVLDKCCCGVEFFAVRDSACTFGGEDCEIAGCDACPVCFEGDACAEDACTPISIGADSSWVFRWNWARDICPQDFGSDPLFGNAGTFRLVTGYHVCGNGSYQNILEMTITVLKQVATFPRSWGSVKARYEIPAGDRVLGPE